ncbi:MAG: stage III sporulation AC/AD family protein [Acutalibacteraceae bacterium]
MLIAVATLILSVVVSQTKKEYSLLIIIAGISLICTVAFKSTAGKLSSFLSSAENLSETYGLISVLLKGALICIMTQLVRDLCKDSGNTALASAVDIAGRMMIIVLSLPLIESVLKTAVSFIN